MSILLTTIFSIFGLIIGSFLNVVILRLGTNKSFGGRSGCMSCFNKLSWYELVPVFSFLGLLGRCKNCKSKISIQYPLVEIATGIVFAMLFIKFQDLLFLNTLSFSFTYAYYAMMFSILIVVAVYDMRHKIIPDILSLVLGILAFFGLFFFDIYNDIFFYWHLPSFLEFCSGVFISAPFALLYFVSRGRWMGFGDAKLALSLGWLIGFPFALSGLVLSFWVGALAGIVLLVFSKKYGLKSEIPFAPYLVLGMFLIFIFELQFFPSIF